MLIINQTEFTASHRKEARSLHVSATWGSYFPTRPLVRLLRSTRKELKVLTLTQQYLKSVVQLLQ